MENKERTFISTKVIGDFKAIEALYEDIVKDGDNVISKTNFRTSYNCLTDIETLPNEVAEVAKVEWTDEVKKAFKNYDPFNDLIV
jgi:regulatory protein YycI of two-component signal transduction system YycFG